MSLIHHVLLWEAKLKILAQKRTFSQKKSAFLCHFKEITLFVPYQPNTQGIEYWWRG